MEKLEKGLDYLSRWHLAGAVLDVFLENERLQGADPHRPKASGDAWLVFSDFRQDLFERARARWCERTGKTPHYFPYSVDGVCWLYLKYRKRGEAELDQCSEEIAAHAAGVNGSARVTGLF